MLRRLLALVIALAVLPIIGANAPAMADDSPCPAGTSPVQTKQGVICVVVTDPGTPGIPSDPGTPGGGGHGPVGCFKADGTEIPCVTEMGNWWPGHQCYAAPYDAPPGTPAWHGHSDGSLWECTACTDAASSSTCHVQTIWTAPGQEPGPPTPGELTSVAVGLMPLAKAEAHTAPQAPDHTYVGVENWLWVPQAQWVTLTKTVTAGNTSVTVTAKPSQVAGTSAQKPSPAIRQARCGMRA
jgi:hypothetical protein